MSKVSNISAKRRHGAFALVSAALLGGGVVTAGLAVQAQPKAGIATAAKTAGTAAPDGAALYAERCAACHDHATGRVPSREVISKNPPTFILSALHGVMAPMAQGLSTPDMVAIANYISKSPPLQDIDPKKIWGDGVAGTPLDGPKCEGSAPPVDLAAANQWNGWSIKPDNARYQPNPGLAAADVPKLKLKWAFEYPGAKNGQATVIGDRLYVTSMAGALYALNAKTGCVYWRHAADAATRTSVTVADLPVAGARHVLFYSDWTKSAVALDADTGRQLWKTAIDDQPAEQMTGSITYWKGKLFVPISSGNEAFAQSPGWECCRFRGALVAMDAVTGKVLWKRYTNDTVPHPFKVNSAGRQQWGPSGGSIWTTPTIDPARGLIYVGTSNSYTDVPYPRADSVLAIYIETGAIRWSHQLTPHDDYIDGCWREGAARPANCPSRVGPDFSIGASPILYHLKSGKDLVVTGSKSGVVHAVDPSTGEQVWERRLGHGSELGGVEFGTAADPEHIYAGVSDIVARFDPKPGVYALDPATGAIVWSTRNKPHPSCRWTGMWCSGAVSQAISVIPGAVFAGAYDGHFRAYDSRDGHIVWDVDTGSKPTKALGGKTAYGGVMDGAGPTVAGGMVYVHSGYAGRSGATAGADMRNADGNVLLAFSVDGR